MLVQVNRIYYYRKTLPTFLKSLLGKKEIWQSLKTKDKHIACSLVVRLEHVVRAVEIELDLGVVSQAEALSRLRAVKIVPKGASKKCTVVISKQKNPAPMTVVANSESHERPCQQPLSTTMLNDWFVKFAEERVAAGRWTPKTEIEYQTGFSQFMRYLWEQKIAENMIFHKTLLDFKAMLMKLPPNAGKKAKYRRKTLMQISQMKHEKTLSIRQINKSLIIVNSFFGWLHQHEYIEKNPAHHLLLPTPKRVDTERSAYSNDEVKTIIAKTKHLTGAKKYVPLIAAYSGLRMNEACSLHVSDIVAVEGIVCFDINDSAKDKRLKTASSARVIPVHPKIMQGGFKSYLNAISEAGHERVFPELIYHSVNGYGQQFGKWYSLFNRQHITSDSKRTFHSFRHSFCNALKQAGVAPDLLSELLGHKVHSISMNRYSSRFSPKIMLEAILNLPW